MSHNVTLCFATLNRRYCVQRLLRSVRTRYPTMPIIVADQSGDEYQSSKIYEDFGVKAIFLPEDAGVSRARNAAVREAETEYVLIADDDFVFCNETDIGIPLSILSADSTIDILGGLLFEVYGSEYDPTKKYERRWERWLFLDRNRKVLIGFPIDYLAPEAKFLGPHVYFRCDAVMNWAVMRKTIFERGAQWDERYLCNGEHEDFYLNLKLNTDIKVGYCPNFIAHHHQPKDFGYGRLRKQTDGWKTFGEKWGLSQYLTLPWGWMPLDGNSTTREIGDVLPDLIMRVDGNLQRPTIGENVAFKFTRDKHAFVSQDNPTSSAVNIWISNLGNLRFDAADSEVETKDVISQFCLSDIPDVRQLSICPLKTAIRVHAGEGSSVQVLTAALDGKKIGALSGENKICLGYRLRRIEDDTFALSSAENAEFTPLTNNIEQSSFQHVNFSTSVENGEYELEVDFWVDGVGWLHRNKTVVLVSVGDQRE